MTVVSSFTSPFCTCMTATGLLGTRVPAGIGDRAGDRFVFLGLGQRLGDRHGSVEPARVMASATRPHGIIAQGREGVLRVLAVFLVIGGAEFVSRTGVEPDIGMGGEIDVVRELLARDGDDEVGVEAVAGEDREFQPGFTHLLDDDAGGVRTRGGEQGADVWVDCRRATWAEKS